MFHEKCARSNARASGLPGAGACSSVLLVTAMALEF
jgi:hypothetical protein